MHDPRIGRFFAVDPLTPDYPHYTPYSFSGNKVIHKVELEGLEEADPNVQGTRGYKRRKKRFDRVYSRMENSGNYSNNEVGLRDAVWDKIGKKSWAWLGNPNSTSNKSNMKSYSRIDQLAYNDRTGTGRRYNNKISETVTGTPVNISTSYTWFSKPVGGVTPTVGPLLPAGSLLVQGLNINLSAVSGGGVNTNGGVVTINLNSANVSVTKWPLGGAFSVTSSAPEVVNILDGNGNTIATSGIGGLNNGVTINGNLTTNNFSINTTVNPSNRGGSIGVWPYYTILVVANANSVTTTTVSYTVIVYNASVRGNSKRQTKGVFTREVRKGKIPNL